MKRREKFLMINATNDHVITYILTSSMFQLSGKDHNGFPDILSIKSIQHNSVITQYEIPQRGLWKYSGVCLKSCLELLTGSAVRMDDLRVKTNPNIIFVRAGDYSARLLTSDEEIRQAQELLYETYEEQGFSS